jgi:hypothetical protein
MQFFEHPIDTEDEIPFFRKERKAPGKTPLCQERSKDL